MYYSDIISIKHTFLIWKCNGKLAVARLYKAHHIFITWIPVLTKLFLEAVGHTMCLLLASQSLSCLWKAKRSWIHDLKVIMNDCNTWRSISCVEIYVFLFRSSTHILDSSFSIFLCLFCQYVTQTLIWAVLPKTSFEYLIFQDVTRNSYFLKSQCPSGDFASCATCYTCNTFLYGSLMCSLQVIRI
jgi:hypothetical protein